MEIEDSGEDSRFLKSSLAKFNDPSVYVLSHIGWGCEHRAEIDPNSYRTHGLEVMEEMFFSRSNRTIPQISGAKTNSHPP